jgi:prefoldin subunit 5
MVDDDASWESEHDFDREIIRWALDRIEELKNRIKELENGIEELYVERNSAQDELEPPQTLGDA